MKENSDTPATYVPYYLVRLLCLLVMG